MRDYSEALSRGAIRRLSPRVQTNRLSLGSEIWIPDVRRTDVRALERGKFSKVRRTRDPSGLARRLQTQLAMIEWSLRSRPCVGQTISGAAAVVVFLIDGLGHGPLAGEAADRGAPRLASSPGREGSDTP